MSEKHWSETLGDWYYVGTVTDQWDYIIHDVEAEDLTDEMAGMFILRRDGTSSPAPTTRAAWQFLANMVDDDEDGEEDSACVGKIVNGMCVPIGGFGEFDLMELP